MKSANRLGGRPGSRLISAAEFGLGALIVIGHNVLQAIPSEVAILVGLGLVSARVRDGEWLPFGLRPTLSWARIAAVALGATVLRFVLGVALVDPIIARLGTPPVLPSGAAAIAGDPLEGIRWLVIVWVQAAIPEEFAYRGYLLARGADALGRSKAADWLSMLAVGALFGVGHYYKGPSGMVDSAISGLFFGATYLLSQRNLWASILVHGIGDTVGVVVLFFGWQS
jgi:CAAX protease family protein